MSTNRSQWGSSVGFILSAVGAAIGLGTIWRFPYLAGMHGGGIFLFTYLVVCLVLGLTLMAAEMCLGRTTKKSTIGAFRAITKNKAWRAVGMLNIMSCWLITWFYYIIGGWVLFYVVKSLDGAIPFTPHVNPQFFQDIFHAFITNPIEPFIYCTLFTLTTLLIVMGGVKKGIEQFSKILLPLRLALMLVLIIRSVTLPGGWAGVEYFLIPDLSKLSMATLLEAMGLAFFTLSIATGIILTYGSYTTDKTNLINSAKWTALLTVFACFLAGLVVLPAVFAFGVNLSAGPSLIFIVMPAIFGHMPFGELFAILFFVMLYFAAQMSAVALLEVLASFLIDELHLKRRHAVLLSVAAILPFCLPISLSFGLWSGPDYQLFGKTLFDFLDYLTSCLMLPIGGILLSLFLGWVAWDAIQNNLSNQPTHPIWLAIIKNSMRFVVPILIFIILVQSN
ncbi:MAG: sodium-dependent transporter [Neisseriales bacterium]|nr:MAG: sodium-dependent transporter [Neisseriales bacterium]